MRIGVITSTSYRHLFFANALSQKFETAIVVLESKQFNPAKVYKSASEEYILNKWFAGRSDSEEQFFKADADAFLAQHENIVKRIDSGKINDPAVIKLIKDKKLDAIAVFGTSLLKANFLESLTCPLINMHLGLSPYYRGAGTNFWPFYNEELEYVGVTLHMIDIGIDSGPIVRQGRPEISADDTPHSIGNKTIAVGATKMIETLTDLKNETLKYHKQDHSKGKLYKRKDFTADHVASVLKALDNDLIPKYAAHPKQVELIS